MPTESLVSSNLLGKPIKTSNYIFQESHA